MLWSSEQPPLSDGKCINISKICNGYDYYGNSDCDDRSDEQNIFNCAIFRATYNNLSTYYKTLCPEGRFIGGKDPHFAIALMCPLLLSTLFILPHWWRLEGNHCQRIITFPIVLLQFWPQYRMAKILYMGLWTNSKKWKEEKVAITRNVSHIGEKFTKIYIHRFSLSIALIYRTLYGEYSNCDNPNMSYFSRSI